ncbi:MAG: hypothetical protein ACLPXZ_06820, partial [Mycobacterium sp.]
MITPFWESAGVPNSGDDQLQYGLQYSAVINALLARRKSPASRAVGDLISAVNSMSGYEFCDAGKITHI